MRHMTLALTWFTLSATASVAAPALKDRKIDDATRILGMWAQEAISVHGNEQNTQQQNTFRFGNDGTCGIVTGSRENPAEYTLDVAKSPRQMKWLNGPAKTEWLCIYELDGDSLKVAFVDQGTEPPKKIEPAKNLTIYYLRRIKD